MMIAIPDVLDPAALASVRAAIDAGEWTDGNATSGHQSALAKRNRQLAEGSEAARTAGTMVIEALQANPTFIAAALPAKIYPPLFNRYAGGEAFGTHIDNAVRLGAGGLRVRSDLSATLFLSEPDSYDGGELVVEDRAGAQPVKLRAGHMLLYPASSLHRVEPVTRGTRTACFFWVQSMIRDDGARRILFDLDNAVRQVAAEQGHDARAVIELTGVYHNLLRRWAEA
jgi:PKHD-type hydroxylase